MLINYSMIFLFFHIFNCAGMDLSISHKEVPQVHVSVENLQDIIQSIDDEDIDYENIRIGKDLILHYVQQSDLFAPEDEVALPSALRKIKKRGNGEYNNLKSGIFSEFKKNKLTDSHDMETRGRPSEMLLLQMKNEHIERMLLATQQFKAEQYERRSAQKKFYVTSALTILATLVSIVEAVFLINKGV